MKNRQTPFALLALLLAAVLWAGAFADCAAPQQAESAPPEANASPESTPTLEIAPTPKPDQTATSKPTPTPKPEPMSDISPLVELPDGIVSDLPTDGLYNGVPWHPLRMLQTLSLTDNPLVQTQIDELQALLPTCAISF
ncbi:MAG: hypothetical protein LBT60_01300 [Oscillospiraceae bacterium]|jgi:cytoskeletal protein RodZ|nr:hypothetical protein [Oscillospiraceae bacterium]